MNKIIIKIDGMMCGMCQSHINDTIRGNFNIKKVSSSYKKGESVIYSEEKIDEEKLKACINETGYKVLSISQTEEEGKKGFSGLFH